jgi:adenylate cyclase
MASCRCTSVALEIERRFLVEDQAWRRHSRWQRALRQGYLVSAADGLTLRVRTSALLGEPGAAGAVQQGQEEAWLTLKAPPPSAGGDAFAGPAEPAPGSSPPQALSRLEFEYAIPVADGEALLGLSTARLSKCRHGLDLPGGDWVLDVFEADNAPLVVAEVELSSPDQVVAVPPWCVRELTGRHELSNAALAARPLARWDAAELRELFG